MLVDAAPPVASWNVVRDAFSRLREDNHRFQQFCEEQFDELESQREEFEQQQREANLERAALSEELDSVRSQLARLASVAVELADARAELVRVKGDLLEQRETAAEAVRRSATLEKQVAQARREIAALESDLCESRDRAEDEKRRLSEQRAEWVGDLLRNALDLPPKDADLKVVCDEESPSEAEAVSRVDPVLGAVMQQFEALQKGRGKGRQGVA